MSQLSNMSGGSSCTTTGIMRSKMNTVIVFCVAAAFAFLMVGPAFAQFVELDVVDGEIDVSGAVVASNTFDEDFFWDYKRSNFSRVGFEDGTTHPVAVYPFFKPVTEGAEFKVTEHAGHDTALKTYWSTETGRTHWEIRGFSKARKELWFSYDLYVPEADPDDPDAPSFPEDRETTISQIVATPLGLTAAIKINGNSLKIMNHGGPSARMSGPIPRGEWNRVTLQIIPAYTAESGHGTLRLWYGGEKVIDRTGIRVTSSSATSEDFNDKDRLVRGSDINPWFGIYAQEDLENLESEERTLFFDNVISYGGDESVLRVEAENFHDYEDESSENRRGFYRPDDSIDIGVYMDDTPYEGAFWHRREGDIIYYVDATTGTLKRLQYDIEIPVAGKYQFRFRAASPEGSGAFTFSLQDEDGESTDLGDINIPGTTWGKKRPDTKVEEIMEINVPDTTREDQRLPGQRLFRQYRIRGLISGVNASDFEWGFTNIAGHTEFLEAGNYTVTLDVKEPGFMLDYWEADLID